MIAPFPGVTRLDRDPVALLAEVPASEFDELIVCGRFKDGRVYFASSVPDGPRALWRLFVAMLALVNISTESD
jgi:hypothetical protein